MHAKSGGHDDACDQEQESVDDVKCEHDDWVDGPGLLDAGRDEVEQREHRKDGHKDGEIDGGRVACESLGDHVTGEGQDEQRPQELKCAGSAVLHSRSAILAQRRPTWSSLRPIFTIAAIPTDYTTDKRLPSPTTRPVSATFYGTGISFVSWVRTKREKPLRSVDSNSLEDGTKLTQASGKDQWTGTVVDLGSRDRDAGKEVLVASRMWVSTYV